MRNDEVIEAWIAGKSGQSGSMSTDGKNLFSYRLLIGEGSGSVIYNHTASGGSYYSQTTSTHVNLTKGLATSAKIINPSMLPDTK